MLKHNKAMIKALKGKQFGTKEWKTAFIKETQRQLYFSTFKKIGKEVTSLVRKLKDLES